MKKIFFLLIAICCAYRSYSQTTGYLRNDTIKITNATKTATLVLETASKGHNWYLKDIGNGRTQFVQATIGDIDHLQDSLIGKINHLNPDFTGNLSSATVTPINPFWTTFSPMFVSRATNSQFVSQSSNGLNGYTMIDASQPINNRTALLRYIYGNLSAYTFNDNGLTKDSLFSINTTTKAANFYGDIFQGGNKVANDNAVLHLSGTGQTVSQDVLFSGSDVFKNELIFTNPTSINLKLIVSRMASTIPIALIFQGSASQLILVLIDLFIVMEQPILYSI